MTRTVLFEAVYGSHNYNLVTPESDKDYKVFVLPNFDDLYKNHAVSSSVVGKDKDVETKDIRLLINLLKQSNPAYLEILFSNDVYVNDYFSKVHHYLISNRLKIINHNPVQFYNATVGHIMNKAKSFARGTSTTQHLVEKYGYDTKNFSQVVRLHHILTNYDFNNYEEVLRYKDGSLVKEYLLSVKNGALDFEKAKQLLEDIQVDVRSDKMKNKYNLESDYSVFSELDSLIYDMIRKSLM